MAAALDLSQLIALHDRLNRMRQNGPELLIATGMDEWLPLLDQLVDELPRLTQRAHELGPVCKLCGCGRHQLEGAGKRVPPQSHSLPGTSDNAMRRLMPAPKGSTMSETAFTFRVDDTLKAQFTSAAKERDRSSAQLLRDFMRTL